MFLFVRLFVKEIALGLSRTNRREGQRLFYYLPDAPPALHPQPSPPIPPPRSLQVVLQIKMTLEAVN